MEEAAFREAVPPIRDRPEGTRPASIIVAMAIGARLLSSGTTAWASEEDAPSLNAEPLVVMVRAECARGEPADRLVGELGLRAPSQVRLANEEEEAADLRWEKREGECGLALTSCGEPVFLPLHAEAESDELRAAASRAVFLLEAGDHWTTARPVEEPPAPAPLEAEPEASWSEPEPWEFEPLEIVLPHPEPPAPPAPPPIPSVHGVQASGLMNYGHVDVDGMQLAGVANLSRGHVKGAQVAGIANWAHGRIDGLQLSWMANYAAESSGVVQISNVNIAGDVRGAQVGFVNLSGELRGAQVGFLNIAADVDYPVGMVNVVRRQPLLVAASLSSEAFVSAGLRHGGRRLRYSYLLGYQDQSPLPYAVGAGFSLARPGRWLVWTFEGLTWQLFGVNPLATASLQELRLLLGLRIGRRFEINVGPALKVLGAVELPAGYPRPETRTIVVRVGDAERVWMWPELCLGLTF